MEYKDFENQVLKKVIIKQQDLINNIFIFIDKFYVSKEKIIEYVNWQIEHFTEDILDYIDDGKEENKNIIGELKEEREHWKDIIRIMNNEKTYIDYKNY